MSAGPARISKGSEFGMSLPPCGQPRADALAEMRALLVGGAHQGPVAPLEEDAVSDAEAEASARALGGALGTLRGDGALGRAGPRHPARVVHARPLRGGVERGLDRGELGRAHVAR